MVDSSIRIVDVQHESLVNNLFDPWVLHVTFDVDEPSDTLFTDWSLSYLVNDTPFGQVTSMRDLREAELTRLEVGPSTVHRNTFTLTSPAIDPQFLGPTYKWLGRTFVILTLRDPDGRVLVRAAWPVHVTTTTEAGSGQFTREITETTPHVYYYQGAETGGSNQVMTLLLSRLNMED